MWKRDDAPKTPPAVTPSAPPPAAPAVAPTRHTSSETRDVVNIGKSVVIKGELSGSEDLTIEGKVEGKIELRQHVLTIGPNGKIRAEINAKAVVVLGEVVGNIAASEKVDIKDNGSVEGDLTSPRVAISEGAHFRGAIDMQRKGGPEVKPVPKVTAPAHTTSPSQPQPVAATK